MELGQIGAVLGLARGADALVARGAVLVGVAQARPRLVAAPGRRRLGLVADLTEV